LVRRLGKESKEAHPELFSDAGKLVPVQRNRIAVKDGAIDLRVFSVFGGVKSVRG
jgi:hypothetical protein